MFNKVCLTLLCIVAPHVLNTANQMAVSVGNGDAHSPVADAVRAKYLARQIVQAWDIEQAALWHACTRLGVVSLAALDQLDRETFAGGHIPTPRPRRIHRLGQRPRQESAPAVCRCTPSCSRAVSLAAAGSCACTNILAFRWQQTKQID